MKRLKTLTDRSRVFGLILTVLATVFGISSCRPDFDLDKRMPEWLGTSIYQTLQEGFKNDSTGEVYSFKTFVRLIEDLDQVEILAKTGSKTLFVADDSAFAEFFKNCPFVDANGNKVTSYDNLSKAQKSMILNGSMLNNVYQVAMLSNSPGGDNNPPILGNCMRRISAADVLDTIPVVKASSLPSNNPYWERLRTKNEGKSIVLLQDGTERPIIFLVDKFLKSNRIDNDDYDFLFRLGPDYSKVGKDRHNPGDASVNGVAIEWPNKKCFNGFLHVMSEVVYLLPNMADYLGTRPDTKIFNAILDRFSVPQYDGSKDAREARDENIRYLLKHGLIKSEALDKAMTDNGDSVYVKKYLAQRARLQTQTQSSKIDTNFDGLDPASASELLKFDPGWNTFISSTITGNSDVALQQDMGLMFVPLDEYFMKWWLDESQIGARLRERYGLDKYKGRNDLTVDEVIEDMSQIELKTILKLVNVNMQTSLVGSVPSKFSSVLNDAQDPFFDKMSRQEAEQTIVDVAMCCNGAIYFTNTVYVPTSYRSVAYPVLVNEKLKIIDWAINEDDVLAFSAYLNSMVAEYSFFVPLIDTVNGSEFENKLVWIDPASFYLKKMGTAGISSIKALAFSYDKNNKNKWTVVADVYDFNETTGQLVATATRIVPDTRTVSNGSGGTKEEDTEEALFVRNRILDLMDYHIIIGDVEAPGVTDDKGFSYFRTKGRGTIKFKGVDDPAKQYRNMIVEGGWQIENEGQPDAVQRPVTVIQRNDLSKNNELTKGNGRTYVLDRPLLPSRRSVYDVVSDTLHYPEFKSFFKLMERTGIFSQTSNTNQIASQYCVSTFNTYHYTVYIPTSASVDTLIKRKVLMMPDELTAIDTRFAAIKTFLEQKTVYTDPAQKDSAFKRDFRDSLINLTYRLFGENDTVRATAAVAAGGSKYLTDIKRNQLKNFVKYHIQDNSVYIGANFDAGIDESGNPATQAEYETAYMNDKQQFVKVRVKGGSDIEIRDNAYKIENKKKVANPNVRTVQKIYNADGKPYFNIMCREYEVKPLSGSSLSENDYEDFSIETSSYAVVHLIDKPLCNGDVNF